MKLSLSLSLLLLTAVGYGQEWRYEHKDSTGRLIYDSVKVKIIKTAEHEAIYEINKMRFISFDCKCSSLKRGDIFMIPKARFDSLLVEAKPVRKRQS